MDSRIVASAAVLSVAAAVPAHAQGVASERLIDAITVTAQRRHAEPRAPSPVASKTSQELRAQNLVNPEDALEYVPNLTIRKRYIGDRNALIGGRSFSTLQAPRGLVFADGYLLSNFLGRFDAPRWNMIAPEEIERVDVLYGPYSALHPGNSIGTTVAVRTRRPTRPEMSVRTTAFGERFEGYGLKEDYVGYQVSAFLGAALTEQTWFALSANRQDSASHPMQYFAVSADAAGDFPALPSGAVSPVAVTGVRLDTDPFGRRRAVFGANAGAIDRTRQDQWKLRGGYAVADWLEADAFIAQWRNDSANENRTFMRDGEGREVWAGRVVAGGVEFEVPSNAFAPSTRAERHLHWGATLRTARETGWNGSVVLSQYAIREDYTLRANLPDPEAAAGGPGSSSERDGTRWRTLELQGAYTPAAGTPANAAHTILVGYHRNQYRLENPVYETGDWRTRYGELVQDVHGETSLQALYVQDAWAVTDRWALTLGVRYEEWKAGNAQQWVRGLPTEHYANRLQRAWSPKASVSFVPARDRLVRLSAGRGVRFPTVAELFLGTVSPTQITRNDPDLKPEVGDAIDLSIEQRSSWGRARVSIFQDEVRDTIWNQVNVLVFPSRNTVQNIDRVRTRGIETALGVERFGVDSLSLEANLACARTTTRRDDKHPDYVGNRWPRIPDWRGSVQATWRPAQPWLASIAVRYSGRMYDRLENDDIHSDKYGGVSRYTTADVRVAYTTGSNVELALGVDNITDERAYQAHPYPGRTAFLEARWSMGDRP